MPTSPSAKDIDLGRVYMLNPGHLMNEKGVKRNCVDGVNPLGGDSPHYFVCVDFDHRKGVGLWCPLSSTKKPNGSKAQGQIKTRYKNGFQHFTAKDSWYDIGQIWEIPHAAAVKWATSEQSNKIENDGNMNHVFPIVIEFIFHGQHRAKRTSFDIPGVDLEFSLKAEGLKL